MTLSYSAVQYIIDSEQGPGSLFWGYVRIIVKGQSIIVKGQFSV